jgi:hypothetical protein
MGRVDLYQFATLLSANGTSSTPVDIQVYAWAEDVVLAGPTNRPVVQSEFIPDGQISGPAAAVAASASALSSVPVLGPYAMATSQVAKKLSSWASYFGYTNVPNVSDVAPLKQVPFSLSSTDISEPVQKLSLHAKAETAVGSQQHGGASVDELALTASCAVAVSWLAQIG